MIPWTAKDHNELIKRGINIPLMIPSFIPDEVLDDRDARVMVKNALKRLLEQIEKRENELVGTVNA